MLKMERKAFCRRLCTVLFFANCVSGNYPKAQNVSWLSINFKTLLMWDPKPFNYSYTVEYSVIGQIREWNQHCIRTMSTECDLSNVLTDLKATYSADVLSEPLHRVNSDLTEFPHTSSEGFTPYQDTLIGRPEFKIEVSKDKRKITLYVEDPPIALFNEQNKLKTMRDVFADELQYKVTFGKATSTGKKTKMSASSEIELDRRDIEPGVSYCFKVQAYIPSRSTDKQLGELSQTQCSPGANKSFFEEFGIGVIAGFILLVITIIVVAIVVTVVCCRRTRKANTSGKEGVPLRSV
ncbi:tissue factor-like [Salvelinus alpinus]|uniref:tissue factor n=1 Tax=Salvelinus sp. IW2-2015 TaxID=2691554 RepID=UPI000CEAFBDA|nr:tissue factor-like [Salvelinus alpinus]